MYDITPYEFALYRRACGASQADLETLANLPKGSVSHWEKGRRPIGAKAMKALTRLTQIYDYIELCAVEGAQEYAANELLNKQTHATVCVNLAMLQEIAQQTCRAPVGLSIIEAAALTSKHLLREDDWITLRLRFKNDPRDTSLFRFAE